MAYLLSLLVPGWGHLSSRATFSGVCLVIFWLVGLAILFVMSSFQVWLIMTLFGLHGLFVLVSIVDLKRLRRKGRIDKVSPFRTLIALPAISILIGIAFFLVTTHLVRPIEIRSGSMTPSVVTGDVVLVQMFGPTVFGIHLGDIVLVFHPRLEGRLLIKRILGMAGDLIEVRSGEFWRNGRRLSQCNLRRLRDHETRQPVVERLEVLDGRPHLVWDVPAVRSKNVRLRVPPGRIFVVGDNRDRSGDSRNFGNVPITLVHGIVTNRIAPVLTDQVFKAPLGARQRAYKLCSNRRGSGKNTRKRR